jgi:hypothetical protein
MNGDALELMQKLGEIHADLKEDIGRVKTEMAEFKGEFRVRLSTIEKNADNDKYWHNVKTFVVIPVTFALHKTASMLGFKI